MACNVSILEQNGFFFLSFVGSAFVVSTLKDTYNFVRKARILYSPAPASFDDHVFIIFQDDFLVLVQVEHGDGRQLRGDTTGARHGAGVDAVDQGLDDGVVGGVQVVCQREGALSVAVVRVIVGRSHDPVVPTNLQQNNHLSLHNTKPIEYVIFFRD